MDTDRHHNVDCGGSGYTRRLKEKKNRKRKKKHTPHGCLAHVVVVVVVSQAGGLTNCTLPGQIGKCVWYALYGGEGGGGGDGGQLGWGKGGLEGGRIKTPLQYKTIPSRPRRGGAPSAGQCPTVG